LTRRIVVLVIVCTTVMTVARPASAQDLSQILGNLTSIQLAPTPPGSGFPSHSAHFLPAAVPGVNDIPGIFNQQMVQQLSTVPLGSSSGGFSFMINPSVGTVDRTTDSFGPMFAERAYTNGKGRLTIGATYQYSKYNSFEGTSLDSGDLKFYLRHQNIGSFVQGDLLEEDLKMHLTSSTTSLFANYGVSDRWDVAIAVPIQHVSMDATVNATILRLSTGANSPIHQFTNGANQATFNQAGSATGIGDITLRTKYRFLATPGGGLAAGLDVRLPTGDKNNLLGAGATQTTVTLIGSTTTNWNYFTPHFNVGFTGSHPESGAVVNVANEFGYRVGGEFVLRPTVTLLADLVGRSLINSGRLTYTDTSYPYQVGSNTAPYQTIPLHEFTPSTGTLNLTSLALGGKFNVAGNLLVTGSVLVSLTSTGLTARVTPVVGFDYSF
jgi:hypothetical protein